MSDIKKDIKKDNKRHTEQGVYISYFTKNDKQKFVLLKTEKLASAIYMITGFMSDTDPMRNKLRSCAIDLISCAIGDEKHHRKDTFLSKCAEATLLLTTADRAGIISSMNAQIICAEYASLGSFFKDHLGNEGPVMPLTELPAPVPPSSAKKKKGGASHAREFKKTDYKGHLQRRDKIMSLFEKNNSISVKDASNVFPELSEKTIQRELISLVNEGVLLKKGERRWSVYEKKKVI